MGFDKCLADECLLKKKTKKGTIIVCVYIHDPLCVGDHDAINEFKKEISSYFAIKEEGKMKEYVGCKVERRGRDNLIMFQDDLINKIEKNIWKQGEKHARIWNASRKWRAHQKTG